MIFADEYDKRLLGTFCKIWLGDVILQDGFQFSEGYGILKLKTVEDYVRSIDDLLPNNEQPGIYGLHLNAGITYQSNSAKGMLNTILDIQPKDSASGGGETREAIVYRSAAEFLEKLPPAFVAHRIKERYKRLPILEVFISFELKFGTWEFQNCGDGRSDSNEYYVKTRNRSDAKSSQGNSLSQTRDYKGKFKVLRQ